MARLSSSSSTTRRPPSEQTSRLTHFGTRGPNLTLPRVRFGPLVPKCVRRDVCSLGGRLVVEELDDSRAMVLGDDIDHLRRQVIAPCNRNACLDVLQDHLGTQFRRDILVDVWEFPPVFAEKLWMQEFADVVVVTPNASHQPVCTNTLR